MDETRVEERLREFLSTIANDDREIGHILDFCGGPDGWQRLLEFIEDGHTDRVEVMLMSSQIGIESGVVEGELVEE